MSQNLVLTDIRKDYTKAGVTLPVLTGVSMEAKPGEIVAILGKSGSGKTTLIDIVAGLEGVSAGFVSAPKGVSYAPQRDLLLPWRTVRANAELPFEIQGTLTDAVRARITALLAIFELTEFAAFYPHMLSGGMRQKASLVRALAQDVPLYLFDEAFSAIDFASRLALLKQVRTRLTQEGKIGIFVTHNIEEGISMADRIIVLSPRPAQIIHESRVTIAESERDPARIRKSAEFQSQFDAIWQVMSRV